jgi:hypothetical protein
VPPPAPPGSEWHSLFFPARRNENTLRVSLFILLPLGIMPPCDLHTAGRDQGRRSEQMSGTDSLSKEGSGLVADHLDACFRDQALSGQGWDGLQQECLSASRHISDAVGLWVWSDSEPREQEARHHLLAAVANLLNISSMVEAMRRAAR